MDEYWCEVVWFIPASGAVVLVAVPGPKNNRCIGTDVSFLCSIISWQIFLVCDKGDEYLC